MSANPPVGANAPVTVLMVPPVGAYPNPYLERLTAALRPHGVRVIDVDLRRTASDRPADIVHVHWPEYVAKGNRGRPALWLTRLARAVRACHRRGGAVVWTLHNVAPHDHQSGWGTAAWRLMVRSADGILSLSQHALDQLVGEHPRLSRVPSTVVGHGELRHAHGPLPSRSDARARLGLGTDDRVLSFLGQVRAYKGVPDLVNAFRSLAVADARLLVAGRVETADLRDVLRVAEDHDDRIQVHDGLLTDGEITTHLAATDLMVLPYRAITHSGSAILAMSHDVPVLAPAIGALPEWSQELGEGWLRLYDGRLTHEVLHAGLGRALEMRDRTWETPSSQHWDTIAAATASLYRTAAQRLRTGGAGTA